MKMMADEGHDVLVGAVSMGFVQPEEPKHVVFPNNKTR
jgi:hypothetical protein